MVISDNIVYKNKIMNKLIGIPDIFTLINNRDIEESDQMKDENIFSTMRVPKTSLLVKNYICFDFNSRIHTRNEALKDVIINVGVICHESELKTVFGNRHDVISGVIEDAFNGSDFLGFELSLVSDLESLLDSDYHVRTLQFKNLARNNL